MFVRCRHTCTSADVSMFIRCRHTCTSCCTNGVWRRLTSSKTNSSTKCRCLIFLSLCVSSFSFCFNCFCFVSDLSLKPSPFICCWRCCIGGPSILLLSRFEGITPGILQKRAEPRAWGRCPPVGPRNWITMLDKIMSNLKHSRAENVEFNFGRAVPVFVVNAFRQLEKRSEAALEFWAPSALFSCASVIVSSRNGARCWSVV